MKNNLVLKLTEWHDSDEHNKIIETILDLPKADLDYELKNLLGRAYNNISEYEKGIEVLMSVKEEGQQDALWNFRMGYAYFYNNEKGAALPYFEKSAALGDTVAKDFVIMCGPPKDRVKGEKPKMVVNNIAWTFSPINYSDAEEFNLKVTEYQKAIYETDANWNPKSIEFDLPEIQICYEAWITKAEDLLENESLVGDDKDTFEKYPEEAEHQVEIIAILKADNGKYFTALEFLMKAHNQQANKELGDHVFFEGTDENPEIVDGLPTYYIACGS